MMDYASNNTNHFLVQYGDIFYFIEHITDFSDEAWSTYSFVSNEKWFSWNVSFKVADWGTFSLGRFFTRK